MGTRARSAHTVSCSAAAARKVSPAQSITRRPMDWKRSASLPMVVVLPTPFTPTISMTMGQRSGGRGTSISLTMMALSISLA